jgi:hypothetical protein
MTGHIGAGIGGVEQQAIGQRGFYLPDALKERLSKLLQIRLANPVPFFPVALAGSLFQINRPDMLDGGVAVPIGQFVFTDSLYHSIKDAVKEIPANGRPGLTIRRGNDAVDDAASETPVIF